MSHTTKIALVGIVLAGAGLIIWRRHMSSITDVHGGYSPSHDLGAASSGTSGSMSQPAPLTSYGSNAQMPTSLSLNLLSQAVASAYTARALNPTAVITPISSDPGTLVRAENAKKLGFY